ncbi:hypothetical protein [Vibrio caribbeanicus]|uniref:hypothetical protein n=1 Tax=Vibrio caribbeanicus TaxID=701175 RepID=UPI0030DBCAD6
MKTTSQSTRPLTKLRLKVVKITTKNNSLLFKEINTNNDNNKKNKNHINHKNKKTETKRRPIIDQKKPTKKQEKPHE